MIGESTLRDVSPTPALHSPSARRTQAKSAHTDHTTTLPAQSETAIDQWYGRLDGPQTAPWYAKLARGSRARKFYAPSLCVETEPRMGGAKMNRKRHDSARLSSLVGGAGFIGSHLGRTLGRLVLKSPWSTIYPAGGREVSVWRRPSQWSAVSDAKAGVRCRDLAQRHARKEIAVFSFFATRTPSGHDQPMLDIEQHASSPPCSMHSPQWREGPGAASSATVSGFGVRSACRESDLGALPFALRRGASGRARRWSSAYSNASGIAAWILRLAT